MIVYVNAKKFNAALDSPTSGDLAILLQAVGLHRGDAYAVAKDIRKQFPQKVLDSKMVSIQLPDWIEVGYE